MKYRFDKYYLDGVGGGRDIELHIDTDVVLDNLNKMATVLDNKKTALLNGFSLGSAWQSSNASLVEQKINEIDASFTEMQKIIDSLKEKVNSYVTGTIEADTVTFNGESGSSVGQVQ